MSENILKYKNYILNIGKYDENTQLAKIEDENGNELGIMNLYDYSIVSSNIDINFNDFKKWLFHKSDINNSENRENIKLTLNKLYKKKYKWKDIFDDSITLYSDKVQKYFEKLDKTNCFNYSLVCDPLAENEILGDIRIFIYIFCNKKNKRECHTMLSDGSVELIIDIDTYKVKKSIVRCFDGKSKEKIDYILDRFKSWLNQKEPYRGDIYNKEKLKNIFEYMADETNTFFSHTKYNPYFQMIPYEEINKITM